MELLSTENLVSDQKNTSHNEFPGASLPSSGPPVFLTYETKDFKSFLADPGSDRTSTIGTGGYCFESIWHLKKKAEKNSLSSLPGTR